MYVCMPVCRKAICGNIAVCNPLKINHVYRKIYPFLQEYTPSLLSTTKILCDPPRIYPSQNSPPFSTNVWPSQNLPKYTPFFNNYIRPSQNLPLRPPFQQIFFALNAFPSLFDVSLSPFNASSTSPSPVNVLPLSFTAFLLLFHTPFMPPPPPPTHTHLLTHPVAL